MSKARKLGFTAAAAITVYVFGAINATLAFATPPDPVDVVGDGAEGLKDTLLDVGVRVLPYAAAVLALTIGWRFAKKFVRGT